MRDNSDSVVADLAVSPKQTTGFAAHRFFRLVRSLKFGAMKRALAHYAAWKLAPFRRRAEQRQRQSRRIEEATTTVQRLYRYRLSDLGERHPSLRGIYTPGYGSNTVRNYLTQQFTDDATSYVGKYTDYEYFSAILEPALRRLNLAGNHAITALDIGSGAGNSIFPLLSIIHGSTIIASDLSVQLLKLLQVALQGTGNEERVELLQLNAEELDFEPSSLDLVVGVAVLHHLYEPERTLAGCAQILKPDGHAIFVEPFAEGGLTLARLYRSILADRRADQLTPQIKEFLGALVRDYELRALPDKTLLTLYQMDDKQLFTRTFFEEQVRRNGFRSCSITAIHGARRQYERQTNTFLRLSKGVVSTDLPDWAWDIIQAEDARLTAAVPIEACVVLTK